MQIELPEHSIIKTMNFFLKAKKAQLKQLFGSKLNPVMQIQAITIFIVMIKLQQRNLTTAKTKQEWKNKYKQITSILRGTAPKARESRSHAGAAAHVASLSGLVMLMHQGLFTKQSDLLCSLIVPLLLLLLLYCLY